MIRLGSVFLQLDPWDTAHGMPTLLGLAVYNFLHAEIIDFMHICNIPILSL